MQTPPKPQIDTRKRKTPSGEDHAGSRPRRPNSEETISSKSHEETRATFPRPPTDPPIQETSAANLTKRLARHPPHVDRYRRTTPAENPPKAEAPERLNAGSAAGNETGPQDPAPGKRTYSHHTDQPAGGHGQRTRQSQVTHRAGARVPPRDILECEHPRLTGAAHRGHKMCRRLHDQSRQITHQKKTTPQTTTSRSPQRTRQDWT